MSPENTSSNLAEVLPLLENFEQFLKGWVPAVVEQYIQDQGYNIPLIVLNEAIKAGIQQATQEFTKVLAGTRDYESNSTGA